MTTMVHAENGDTSNDLAAKQLTLGIQLLAKSSEATNRTVSPFSIHAALMLARMGAEGQTAEELDRLLLPSAYSPTLLERYHSLITSVSSKGDDVVARLANSIWLTDQATLQDRYRTDVKNMFSAEPYSINFTDSERARKTINSWVSDQTNSLIRDLIPRGAITPDTLLTLANALYFKAPWSQEFSKRATRDQDFWPSPTKSVKVPTMHLSGQQAYFENADWQSIQLWYLHDTYSFLLLVPKQKLTSEALTNALTARLVQEALQHQEHKRIDLALPRFKAQHSQELSRPLQELGIQRLFSGAADLSRIASIPMRVSVVQHESMVAVDEEGTEATAATAILMPRSAAVAPHTPVEVKADHPFAFIIFHHVSNVPLFIGVVGDPSV